MMSDEELEAHGVTPPRKAARKQTQPKKGEAPTEKVLTEEQLKKKKAADEKKEKKKVQDKIKMQKKQQLEMEREREKLADIMPAVIDLTYVDPVLDIVDLTHKNEADYIVIDKEKEGIWAEINMPKNYRYDQVIDKRTDVKADTLTSVYKPTVATSDREWREHLNMFIACSNWAEMKYIVEEAVPVLDNIPDQLVDERINTDLNDVIAQHCCPILDVPYVDPYCVRTKPDGNCLFHAISRLLYGVQSTDRATELRVRMLWEAVKHEDWYLDHDYLTAGINWVPRLAKETSQVCQIIRATGIYKDPGKYTDLTKEDQKHWFRTEIYRHRFMSEHSGLFILHIMSNVLRRPILSMMPESAKSEFRDVHRMILPYLPEDRQRDPAVIMWTFGGYKVSAVNHFVAVVK